MVLKKVFCATIFWLTTRGTVGYVNTTKTKCTGSSCYPDAECTSSLCVLRCVMRWCSLPVECLVRSVAIFAGELCEAAQLLFKRTPKNEYSIRARLPRKTDMTMIPIFFGEENVSIWLPSPLNGGLSLFYGIYDNKNNFQLSSTAPPPPSAHVLVLSAPSLYAVVRLVLFC